MQRLKEKREQVAALTKEKADLNRVSSIITSLILFLYFFSSEFEKIVFCEKSGIFLSVCGFSLFAASRVLSPSSVSVFVSFQKYDNKLFLQY